MISSSTLVVFCRRPAPGVGKQRLAADLGQSDTVILGQHLLAAALEDAADWPGDVILSPADPEDAGWMSQQLQCRCRIIPQPGGNLGERINAVDSLVRGTGRNAKTKMLVFIGSDAPILDADYFARARTALLEHDVVLGPAEDGGVTLMAARQPWPDLQSLPWSTEKLARELERSCQNDGQTVYHLPVRYDIDRPADLARLNRDLKNDRRPARQRLQNWLESLDNPYNNRRQHV
jgi:rSAM/selenodomain-associated transferase 1